MAAPAAALVELAKAFPRQALDAVTLGFSHPSTAEPVSFSKQLSNDISDLIERLERIQN
jgi:hypothetical protein